MKLSTLISLKKCLIFTIFVIQFVGYTPVAISQTLSWTQKSNYGGGATYSPFAFVIGNKAYVGTGRALPASIKDDFWEYDPQTDVWTQKADFLGTARYGAKAFSIGNFGYAGTGWTPSATSTFYKYDPLTNVWTPIANFGGSARYTGTAFSLGNFGYMGLGYSPCKNDFWRYDPVLNSWAQTASLPGGVRQAASAFTINGLGYVGAGSCNSSIYQDFYKYDPSNNTWTSIAPFPGTARAAAFSFSLGTDGYLGMGFNYPTSSAPYTIFKDFWKYDSNINSWIQLPDFPGGKLYEGVSFSIGNKGYVGMGSDTALAAPNYVDMLWEYGLSTGINEIGNTSSNLKCYPNPVLSKLTVELNSDFIRNSPAQIQIFDMNGKLVKSSIIDNVTHSFELDVYNLTSGNYSLCLIQNTVVLSKGKFIKQ